jgi:hypothetical protein
VLRQQPDVASPRPQRREIERHYGQAVHQIGPELPGGHELGQRPVAGAHDADVGFEQPFSAEGAVGGVLEEAQQRHLPLGAQRLHFVEKQGAAMRGGDQADNGVAGVGECAADVAEQLAFEQGVGHGAAVDGDERTVGAAAQIMDGPGGDFLARPDFALDEDGRVAGGDAVNHPNRVCERSGLPYQLERRDHRRQILLCNLTEIRRSYSHNNKRSGSRFRTAAFAAPCNVDAKGCQLSRSLAATGAHHGSQDDEKDRDEKEEGEEFGKGRR